MRISGGCLTSCAWAAGALPDPSRSAPTTTVTRVLFIILVSTPTILTSPSAPVTWPLSHQKGARDLPTNRVDLLPADPLGLQARHEHLEPVGGGGIAALPQIGPQHEMTRPHASNALGGVGERHLGRMATPFERRLRPHEDAQRAELHLRPHVRRLLHLRLAHRDHVELRVG